MEKNSFCCSTFFIDCDHPAIKDKSAELTDNIEEVKEKAIRLFYFVKDRIRYNIYTPRATDAHFKASHVLASKEGYCVQKAVLLVALARAANIPARLRFAEIRSYLTTPEIVKKRGSNVFPYHGLTDLYINGRWVKATPTYDPDYCKKMYIASIHFDGQNDAMLPALTEDGRPNVEYIQDRGFFDDLPTEEIRKASLSWKYMKS
jgi:transglutaminase-like putative cysteine protease